MLIPILGAFLAAAAVFLFLWWWRVDRPIRELIHILASAPSKDFLVRAPVRSGVVGKLAQTYNRLLERITALDAYKLEAERQLIAIEQDLKYRRTLEEKNLIIERNSKDLEARLKELRLLYDLSQKVSATLEVDELYHAVEKFIAENLGFNEFALLVYEEEAERLVVKAARGLAENRVLGMTFRKDEGITGRVLAKGEAIYIPDTGLDVNYLYYKGEKREDGSFLSVPLLWKKKVVGVLNMFRRGVSAFSQDEVRFLDTMSVELAVALVNAQLYSRTRELSVKDELTQLYNRRHFQETLPLEIKRAQRFQKPFSLLMIDIDHFKRFNDGFGHLAGDACLKEFVHLVNSRIREVDFFARFGGEEFVLILPNTGKEDGFTAAEKIRLLVTQHPFVAGGNGKTETLTVSIGLAAYPEDAQTVEDLVDAADIALYQAKGMGRDRVCVFTSSAPRSPSLSPPSTASSYSDSATGTRGGKSA